MSHLPNAKAITWNWQEIQSFSDDTECYELSEKQIAVILPLLEQMSWSTRWFDRPTDYNEILEFVGDLSLSLMLPSEACSGSAGGGGSKDEHANMQAKIGKFIELLREIDMKYRVNGELYEVVLDLVPCGCGDGGDGGDGSYGSGVTGDSGSVVPIGSAGGDYGEFITLCDVITSGAPYIASAVDEFYGAFVDGTVWDRFPSLASPQFGFVIELITSQIDQIRTVVTSTEYLAVIRDVLAKTFPNPLTAKPSRADLVRFAVNNPIIYDGTLMYQAMWLWASVTNREKFWAKAQNWQGTGDEALCAAVGARVNRVIDNPNLPSGTTEPTINLTSGGENFVIHINNTAMSFAPRSDGIATPYDIVPAGVKPLGGGTWFTDGAVTGGVAPGLGIRLGGNGDWLVSGVSMVGVTEYVLDGWDTNELTSGQFADIASAVKTFLQHPTVDLTDTTVIASVDNANDRSLESGSGSSFTGTGTIAASWWFHKV